MEKNEEKVLTAPSEKNFSLNKVKLIKDGGLDVCYQVIENEDGNAFINKYHVESLKNPHPDLMNCFKELRPIMARVFNLTSYLSMVETPDFKATKAQKEYARDYADEILKFIDVRGVAYSGTGDKVGVILTGLLTTAGNLKTCINTPRLKYEVETFGFEEELENICGRIEREVYEFLFNGKNVQGLQGELFGADGEPNEPETDDEE